MITVLDEPVGVADYVETSARLPSMSIHDLCRLRDSYVNIVMRLDVPKESSRRRSPMPWVGVVSCAAMGIE